MKAPKVECQGPKHKGPRTFIAPRRDTLYCSQKCRQDKRMEDAKFAVPKIPKSGVKGVTFSRFHQSWAIKVKINDGSWKYIGLRKDLKRAIQFQKEIQNG